MLEDQFIFEGFGGTPGVWELISDGGADVLRVDVDNDSIWDMTIQLNGLSGTLSNSNFGWL